MSEVYFTLIEIREMLHAIITVAISDFLQGDAREKVQATQYFNGPVYQKHLKLLELPASWLPKEIQREALLALRNRPQLAYVGVKRPY